ncbi:MAG TPA: hypothetical protein PK677_17335 [Acidiphilium sp.]|uniref:hypothetical protein n=1 Tax=unclassified Acidiphilium TaxID=2617493 RepID=UPI00257BAB57|nr:MULTISPECIES: hypothetical protein [unclassified Acidiphilium]HQT90268.1 hypothetical protein [Acidiphilium sp.]
MFDALGAEKIDAASGIDILHPAQMQEVVRNGGDGALVDQRGEAIVDPTTISLPANARARVAGDIVVCAAPPATFAAALELLGASGTLSEARLKDLRRDVAWVEDHRSQ